MKKLSGMLLFTILVCIAIGQPTSLKQDSLEKLLASSQADTNRVMILSELSIRYIRSSHDMAMTYAQEGLTLARVLKFRKGEADCLRRSGLILFQQGRYPEALDRYQRALSISENINYPFGIGAGLGHIGNIYNVQGDYARARSYYLRHLKISEATQNESEQVAALASLGGSHLQQGYLDSASIFFNRALMVMNNKGNYRLADIWKNMGELQAKMGNEAEAMIFFRKSVSNATTANDFITLCDSYVGIAYLYRKAGQSDSTIFYARRALIAGQQNNYAKGILAASVLLSEVYEPIDEHEAFKFHKMATAVKDSLFNTEKANQVQNLFFVEHQRQQEIEDVKKSFSNKVKLYIVLAALALFLMLAIVLYRNNRNKQKANEMLHRQKQEIDQQRNKVERALEELQATQSQLIQSEKMASLGELTAGIAHEIQNPLNFVNNFSEINRELIIEMDEEIDTGNLRAIKAIAKDIKENEEKINHHGKRADAIVKGMLQHAQSSKGQKEPTDINKLADEYLRLAFHGLRANDKSFNATFKTEFEESIGKVNIIPQDIGRVLLNLFNNAFYSIHEKKKLLNGAFEPTVLIATKRLKETVQVSIKDNGIGIPQKLVDKIFQPFFTTKPAGQGTGLGLSLSYDIVKAHGGEISVENKEGEYTNFIVTLPLV